MYTVQCIVEYKVKFAVNCRGGSVVKEWDIHFDTCIQVLTVQCTVILKVQCTVHYTVQYTMQCREWSTVQYTKECTVHCTVKCSATVYLWQEGKFSSGIKPAEPVTLGLV